MKLIQMRQQSKTKKESDNLKNKNTKDINGTGMSDLHKMKDQLLLEKNDLWSENKKLLSTTVSDKRKIKEAGTTIEKYKSLFLASSDAIGLIRISDGKYMEVNESFYKLLEFSIGETIGNNLKELDILPIIPIVIQSCLL